MKKLVYFIMLVAMVSCNTMKRATYTESGQATSVVYSDLKYMQQVKQDSANVARITVQVQELRSKLSSLLEQVSRIENTSTIEREFSTEGVLIKERINETNVSNESNKQSSDFSTTFYETRIQKLDSTVNLYMAEVLNLRASYDSLRVQSELQTQTDSKTKQKTGMYVMFFWLGVGITALILIVLPTGTYTKIKNILLKIFRLVKG